jgi:curved DNA-binding protein CbpA
MEIDYYKDLGVEKNATTAKIKSAFRKLAHKYHPDVNKDDKDADSKFRKVYKAYEVLSNPEKRSKYDNYGDTGEYTPPPYTEEQRAAEDAAYEEMRARYKEVSDKAETATYIYFFVAAIIVLIDLFIVLSPFFEKIERNRRTQVIEEASNLRQGVINKIDDLLEKYKPIYLYTNDTGATAKIFPDISDSINYDHFSYNPYDYSNWRYDTTFMHSFLQNPDSIGIITLINFSDGNTCFPTNGFREKHEEKMLKLMIYDIKDVMPHKTFKFSNGKEIVLNKEKYAQITYLSFNNQQGVLRDLSYRLILQQLSDYPDCKLYLTPVVSNDPKKHIDALLFKEAIMKLNKQLNSINKKKRKKIIDTASFQLSVHAD